MADRRLSRRGSPDPVPEWIEEQRTALELRDALAVGSLNERRDGLRELLSQLTSRQIVTFQQAALVEASLFSADEGDRVAAFQEALAELVVLLAFDSWPPSPDEWSRLRGEGG